MPVLVVGGATPFGHQLCEALLDAGGQVRAYVTELDEATPLRAIGVHVAIGGWLDVERLEAACAQVHTVIHLTGARAGRKLKEEEEAFEVTAIATHAADVPRVVVGIDASRRVADAVRTGLRVHGPKTAAQIVECELSTDDSEAVAELFAADARMA